MHSEWWAASQQFDSTASTETSVLSFHCIVFIVFLYAMYFRQRRICCHRRFHRWLHKKQEINRVVTNSWGVGRFSLPIGSFKYKIWWATKVQANLGKLTDYLTCWTKLLCYLPETKKQSAIRSGYPQHRSSIITFPSCGYLAPALFILAEWLHFCQIIQFLLFQVWLN